MAGIKDGYRQKLGEIADKLEVTYGLAEQNELGIPYVELDIESVMLYQRSLIKNKSAEEKKNINSNAGKIIVLIAYVSDRLDFYKKRKLDYNRYPRIDTIARCLLPFVQKDTISSTSLAELNKIVHILRHVDEHLVSYRSGLGYRYLRLFTIISLWGNYCNASIIAKLIINQLTLRED